MSKAVLIGLDLFALGLLIAYWEWRHQVLGWGRGYMRQAGPPKHRHNYIARIEEMVWGPAKEWDHLHVDEGGEVHISVRREIDMPLPEKAE